MPLSQLPSKTRLSLGVAGIVAILTVLFHVFLAERPYGVSFAIFVAALVIGMHGIAWLSGRRGNAWAYLFLVPVFFATLATLLFASDVVIVLAVPLSFGSLIFFSYWFTHPLVSFREVTTWWPRSLLLESVLPLEGVKEFFDGFMGMSQGRRVLMGMGIALPFLLIIGALFVSADPLFEKYLVKFFWLDHAGVGEIIPKLIRDFIVVVFLLRAGWAMLTRATHHRAMRSSAWNLRVDSVVLTTFLGAMNVLFFVFVLSQLVYFFGGATLVQEQGLTYAEYARNGFFQLLAVAGIVFGITTAVYRLTDMRVRISRILSVVLVAQTMVVIISALKRLGLYVDVYGMTLSRLWAYAVMLVIGVVLLAVAVSALKTVRYGVVAKHLFLGGLIVFTSFLLLNPEERVTKWNVNHFLAGADQQLDLSYLLGLSSDAIPMLVTLANSPWKNEPSLERRAYGFCSDAEAAHARTCLRAALMQKKQSLEKKVFQDWRNPVWSDYRALSALSGLK